MSAEKLRELKTLASVCPELNMANYGEDDVRHLNDWAIEMSLLVEQYALSQQPAQATQAEVTMTDADTVQVYGVKDGVQTLIGSAPMPPRMKARELAREQFGHFEDGDGSDAELCFGALEQLIDHMERSAHRAILAQRPERVPMTEDQVWNNDALMSANGIAGFKMDALMRIVRAAEAHHDITAQPKGEQ